MAEIDRYRVLILPGSVRIPSHSVALAHRIKTRFQDPFDVEILDDISLPHADPRYHRNPLDHELKEIREIARIADSSDAFVWVSPIYHNSYSSHLKTILDHLAIRQFSQKVVGLASHGGNRSPQAVDHLRIVARGLNAVTTPSHVCTADEDYVEFNGAYDVTSEDILDRVDRLVTEICTMTVALTPLRRDRAPV
ncbi:NAD(P)H-dependent FMN reductase [Mycolicibacterium sp. BK556]|uniref:NADPH-dependent FMN reductase n=1 Tax=unclassified Mycolicibacterium TaxID=2636767 RepID=UPI001614C63D|nr:NAD(P)H-dependent FMN reductase [Mycolicibacterium sp. BK556]MBB3632955.1 NAD(P)H-dependent FMN reductase [Mycolicibacterium sp. BK607]